MPIACLSPLHIFVLALFHLQKSLNPRIGQNVGLQKRLDRCKLFGELDRMLLLLAIQLQLMNLNKDWASGKGAPTRRNVRMLIDENYMLNSMDTSQEPNSLSDHDITLIGAYEELKKNMSEDVSRGKIHNFPSTQADPFPFKIIFEPIHINPSNHKSLLRAPFHKPSQIQFSCFSDKKIVISEVQLREWENELLSTRISSTAVQCWQIIQEVIKRLCMAEFNFQPLYVRPETFQLFVVKSGKTEVQQCINQKELSVLFECRRVNLRRIPRAACLTESVQIGQKEVKQQVTVQILSPDNRDIVQQIQKSKSVANLKQKIATYYYQIVGQVILVSYSQFKLVGNQTKIAALPEKVLEIYQAKHQYIDPSFVKRGALGHTLNSQLFEIVTEDNLNGDLSDTFVNEDWAYGRLWLRIEDKVLIERYTGGLVGYVQNDRIRRLSLITLTGVKISEGQLKLQFQSKEGAELIVYNFQHANLLKQVVSHILIITRSFNHAIANLE